MSAELATYRAKAPCKAGGSYRRAGEEFTMARLHADDMPEHLEEIKGKAATNAGKAGSGNAPGTGKKPKNANRQPTIPKEAQVTQQDMGAGEPVPSGDVTSADMIRQ